MMRVMLRIVAEALFGDDLADDPPVINREFPVIVACLATRIDSPIRPPVWVPTANNRRLRPALAALDVIVERLIATKRGRLADGGEAQDGHRDLLTSLMLARDSETGEAMSDAQLRDELMTFMIAGHETLRLYPHLWMFDRRGLGPDDLAGTKVAKGDLVVFCPYSIHRLPELWPDPEAFRLERFAAGREEQKNKFAYLPFSVGPGTCIGNNLAMIESQLIMGTLLSRFRARLADPAPITPRGRFTLRPSRPVELRLARAPLP